MKIVQIGKEVGFSNVSYFCQSFREYCGVSPEKYRKGETEDEEIGQKMEKVVQSSEIQGKVKNNTLICRTLPDYYSRMFYAFQFS